MEIKPIKTKKDYKNALKEIDSLWDAKLNTPRGDKLDILITLVEAWENKYYPIQPPNPIEAIKFYMEQNGLERKDVVAIFGSRGRVSEILSGKRQLTLNMIRELHNRFHIPANILIT